MTESDDELCRKCGQPNKKAGSGRLTEWITVCTCNAVATESVAPAIELCKTCGKRVSEGRSGSFTQWVFRPEFCSCGSVKTSSRALAGDDKIAGVKPAKKPKPEPAPHQELYADRIPIERYSVIREIGKGAAGTVFLCHDQLLKKLVAIKSLNQDGRSSLLSFQNEAKATSKLVHANIVGVIDFGVTDAGKPYMVLEYFDGLSLDQYIRTEGPMEVSLSLEIFEQICDALIYAHSHGIFHRDLKPSNVLILGLLDDKPAVRLIDFGVAGLKYLKDDSNDETGVNGQHVTLVGTPPYMSPDQARGNPYDARSEVYSLGCVFFETLTGRPPFRGTTALETINMHAHASIPTLRGTIGDASGTDDSCLDSLEEVMSRCLAKDPKRRFQNVSELKDALSGISVALATNPDGLLHPPIDASSRSSAENNFWQVGVLITGIVCAGTVVFFLANLMLNSDSGQPEPLDSVDLAPKREAEITGLRVRVGGADWLAIIDSDSTRGLKRLKQHSQAKNVWLETPVSNEMLKHLIGLEPSGLGITDTSLTEADLAVVAKMDSVRMLLFPRMDLTDANLQIISSMANVDTLVLQSNKISDRGLAKLASLPHLTKLSLCGMTQVNDDSVDALVSLPHVTALSVGRTGITAGGALRLIKSGRFKGLCLSGIPLTPAVYKGLENSRIQKLALMSSSFLDNDSLDHIVKMKDLNALDVRNCPSMTKRVLDTFQFKRAKAGLPFCAIMYGPDHMAEDWDVLVRNLR